jgi:hypothetical protein
MGCLSVIFSPKTADNKLFAQRTRRRRIFHDQTIMYLNCNSFAYKKRPGWETVFTGLRMKRAAWATKVCTHAFMSPENGDKGDKQ